MKNYLPLKREIYSPERHKNKNLSLIKRVIIPILFLLVISIMINPGCYASHEPAAYLSAKVDFAENIKVSSSMTLPPEDNCIFWILEVTAKNIGYLEPMIADYSRYTEWGIAVASKNILYYPWMGEANNPKLSLKKGQSCTFIMHFEIPREITLDEAQLCYRGQPPFSYGKLAAGGISSVYDFTERQVIINSPSSTVFTGKNFTILFAIIVFILAIIVRVGRTKVDTKATSTLNTNENLHKTPPTSNVITHFTKLNTHYYNYDPDEENSDYEENQKRMMKDKISKLEDEIDSLQYEQDQKDRQRQRDFENLKDQIQLERKPDVIVTPCSRCWGNRQCSVCEGTGKKGFGSRSVALSQFTRGSAGKSEPLDCPHCNGTGICPQY